MPPPSAKSMAQTPPSRFSKQSLERLSEKSLEALERPCLVAGKAATWRFWLRFNHSWEPTVGLIWNFRTVSLETVRKGVVGW
jgi:hypothetical protein